MKRVITALIVCVMILSFTLVGNAKEVTQEKEFKPADIVVVMDTSGSMLDSDKKRTVPDAVRMLVNMMPASDTRVGIIGFNRKPTPVTTGKDGDAALMDVKNLADLETIRSNVSAVKYNGATGIGNALIAATELLDANKNSERSRAIILFTDGVDDFSGNKLALSECESNEVSAIQWAKENECPVYCVGYDYIMNGVNSMGDNGEGLKKLQNISNSTNGKFKSVHDVSEIEDLFIEFIADVFDVIFVPVDSLPGDGNYHESKIKINPSVIEANIRIACGTDNAIKKGKIRLFDPSGNEIELRNSGNIRVDKDATAASIKIILPKTGDWLLTVDDIYGDDIHIGLLEHFKMNLTSQLIFPPNNPEGVAYTNDTIKIKTWLTYDGEKLEEEALYNAVKSAEAVCVSKADPKSKKSVTLSKDGLSFVGSFTIPEDCFYDITVRLEWDTVHREDTLTIASTNKPVTLVKDIGDIKVNKGKTFELKDLYSYVEDFENDPVKASVKSILKNDVCKIDIKDDVLKVTGVKGWWADTIATVVFKDKQGNEVETTFKVSVGDPWATALVASIIFLIVVLIVLLFLLAFRSRIHLFGKIRICSVSEGEIDDAGNFKHDSNGFAYVNPNATSDAARREMPYQPNAGNGNTANAKPGPAPTTGGIFNGTQAGNTQPGGLFGGGTSTSGLFGTQTENAQPGRLFGGGTSTSGLFGTQTENAQPGELLDNNAVNVVIDDQAVGNNSEQNTQTNGLFGNNNSTDSEIDISNQFKGSYDFGGKKIRKISLESAFAGYLDLYSAFMTRKLNSAQSVRADDLKKRLGNISVQLSKMILHGTIGGKGGAVLKIDKNLLKKEKVKITTPRLAGNKAELPYYDKGIVTLSFNVITDDKAHARRGIHVCVEFERN